MDHTHRELQETTWKSYLPLLVVAAYILGGTAALYAIAPGGWMRAIMFFEGLMLSFFALFKLLDIKGFQEGYSTYDLIAKRVPAWGYGYPFVELGLGVALLLNVWTVPASCAVALLAVVGLLSVTIELRKDRKLQCACLGTALNVPLTRVTLIENGVMLVLALVMVVNGFGSQASTATTRTSGMAGMNHSVTIRNDKDFLTHMVPHHQDAVDASLAVASRTNDPEIKKLAVGVIVAQTGEIAEMKGWYKAWYGTDFPSVTSYVPMMGDYRSVSIDELDGRYLFEMIAHHESAIETAKAISGKSEHPEVRALAGNIIVAQRGEIDAMKKMLKVPASTMDPAMHM